MDSYKETHETWNEIAPLYQDKFMKLDIYNHTFDFFCQTLNLDKPNLLEIGCGPGNITKYILSKNPGYNITGIDVAPNMVKLALENNPTAVFNVMDCRNIDELKTKFDAVLCGFCLPYLSESDCSKLIGDCQNIIDGPGMLYISFVEGNPADSGYQVNSNGSRTYFYYHSLRFIDSLLSNNNFKKIQSFKIDYKKGDGNIEVHTILIAQSIRV